LLALVLLVQPLLQRGEAPQLPIAPAKTLARFARLPRRGRLGYVIRDCTFSTSPPSCPCSARPATASAGRSPAASHRAGENPGALRAPPRRGRLGLRD